MGIARGELQILSYNAEAAFGTRAAGNFTLIPHNSESLVPVRQWFESQRSLGDRQVADGRLGRKSVTGDITSEMTYTNLDRFLEQLFCSTKVTAFTTISAQTDITAAAVDQSFADASNGLGGLGANEWIYVTGFTSANNNGMFKIATVAAAKITCYGTGITDEASGDSITIREVSLTNGVEELFSTIHKKFVDETGTVDEHDVLGAVISQGALTVPANGIATMTWSIIGRDYDTTGASVTNSAMTDTSPFDGLSGTFGIDNTASTVMTAFSLTIANGHTPTEPLGTTLAGSLIPRKFRVTGSFSVYHTGVTQIDKLLNETESSLTVTLSDPAGNQHVFLMPRVKYTSAGATKTDDGPVMETINFTALKDQDATEKTIGLVMIPA